MASEENILQVTGCKSLMEVTELKLSSLKLKCLDVSLINKLQSLEKLDLSSNLLQTLPNVNLPNLTILNIDHNMIKDVEFLEHFSSLEELHMLGNPLLVDDLYIALHYLPHLKLLNGKDCSSYRDLNTVACDKLYPQVARVWESHFKSVTNCNGSSDDEKNSLLKRFLSHLRKTEPRCPEIPDKLQKFTHFKVKCIGTEYFFKKFNLDWNSAEHFHSPRKDTLRKAVQRTPTKLFCGSPRKEILNYSSKCSPQKRKLNQVVSICRTPEKCSSAESPKKLSKFSPRKELLRSPSHLKNGSPSKCTPSPRKILGTPKKILTNGNSSPKKRTRSSSAEVSCQLRSPLKKPEQSITKKTLRNEGQDKISNVKKSEKLQLKTFVPEKFFRCHSKDDDPNDSQTQVWRAAFEPDPEYPGMTTGIVAVCGGSRISFLDCLSCKVIKKFLSSNKNETFYCIGWTILEIDGKKETVLAAGGSSKSVSLIHYGQCVKYLSFKAHTRDVNSLEFHPVKRSWLFSGSEDKKIHLWDVGLPELPSYNVKCVKLCTLEPGYEVLNLIFSKKHDLLLAACHGGLFGFNIYDASPSACKKTPSVEFSLPSKTEGKSENEPLVDGLDINNDTVVTKCAGSGILVTWSLDSCLEMWSKNTKAEQKITVQPITRYRWSNTQVDYLYLTAKSDIAACGDEEGSIWVYDLRDQTEKCTLNASLILEWPECSPDNNLKVQRKKNKVNINSTVLSPDGSFLVACTDINIVCVWKRMLEN